MQVGTPVAAIGSPFGEKQSLSVGVVSAVDRAIGSLTEFQISGAIQTDAAINPGNSGGPLVDGRGRVIGVNQQIKSRSGGGEGVGFAVPAAVVQRSLDGLRKDGKVRYAYLGVQSVELYPQLVDRFDLPVGKGAWVQVVQPDGPGAKAGLQGGKERGALPGADVHRRRGHHHQDRRPQDRHARRPVRGGAAVRPGPEGQGRGLPRRQEARPRPHARRAAAQPAAQLRRMRGIAADLAHALREIVAPRLGAEDGRAHARESVGGDVTFAIDAEAEAFLEGWVAANAPGVAFYSEDRGMVSPGGSPEFVLVVDPIDGTRPALAGLEAACTSVALAPLRRRRADDGRRRRGRGGRDQERRVVRGGARRGLPRLQADRPECEYGPRAAVLGLRLHAPARRARWSR